MGGEQSTPINNPQLDKDSMTFSPTYPDEEDEPDAFSDSPPMTSAAADSTKSSSSSSSSLTLPALAQKLYSSNILHQTPSAQVWSFAFSPLHPHVAAGTDEHVLIYNTSTLTPVQTLMRTGTTRSVAYSTSGRHLAVGGDDRVLTLYDASDAKEYKIAFQENAPGSIGGTIRAVAYSPSHSNLLVYAGKGNKLVLFDTESKVILKAIDQSSTVWTLAYSPSGDTLAVAGHDRSIVFHDSLSLQPLQTLEKASAIKSLAYSPDGSMIVAGYSDHVIQVLDASTKSVLSSHRRGGAVECVAFSRDGRTILAGGWDSKVAMYDAVTMDVVREWSHQNTIWAIECSLDGEAMIVGGDDRRITLYDASTKTWVHQVERLANARAVAYSPNGMYFAAGGHDHILTVYSTATLQPVVGEVQRPDTVRAIRFSPNGERLAVAGEAGTVTLYNVTKFEEGEMEVSIEWKNGTGSIFSLDFCPNRNELALGGSENKVIVLDSQDLTFVSEIQREGWVRTIAYSRDGKYLAAGGDDKKVTVYNKRGTKVFEYERAGWVYALAFSPDSSYLAAGGNDKKLTIHDFKCDVLNEYEVGEVTTLTYSPDGRFLAIAGNGKELQVLDVRANFNTFIPPILLSNSVSAMAYYPLKGRTDFQTLTVANGPLLTSIKLHSFATTPVEVLLSNGNDSELIGLIRQFKLPAHQQVNLIRSAVNSTSDRTALVAKIISQNPSFAPLAMQNSNKTKILTSLEDHHQLKELNLIANCESFRSLTSENNLEEMLSVLLKLARKQFTSSVVNFLNAKEHASLPGFVHVKDTYLLKKRAKGWFTSHSEDGRLSPLSETLPPLTFNAKNVSDAWKHLDEDQDQQIQVRILRGLLPDLGSFESLKAFTRMKDSEPFGTHALRAAIDSHWSDWARRKFYVQAIIYFITILSFVIFCDMTVDNSNTGGSVYIPCSITIIGLLYFTYKEIKQYFGLGGTYFLDIWNLVQWITTLLILTSVTLRLTDSHKRLSAVVSSLAILFGWSGSFFYFRGIEDCAWICTALGRIAISMVYFLVVLVLVLIGFALFFQNLYKYNNNSLASTAADEDLESKIESYSEFGHFGTSMISMFNAGVLGNLEVEPLLKTFAPDFAIIMMIVQNIAVTVLGLNALIAFIGTAFEGVLAQKLSVLKKQKALIILDLYSTMSKRKRRQIELWNKWTTIIVPAERLELDRRDVTENQAKATKGDVMKLSITLARIQKEIREMHAEKNDSAENYNSDYIKLSAKVESIEDDIRAILNELRTTSSIRS